MSNKTNSSIKCSGSSINHSDSEDEDDDDAGGVEIPKAGRRTAAASDGPSFQQLLCATLLSGPVYTMRISEQQYQQHSGCPIHDHKHARNSSDGSNSSVGGAIDNSDSDVDCDDGDGSPEAGCRTAAAFCV